MTLVIGLDIGSTSTKAALVDVDDRVQLRHVEQRPTPTTADALLAGCAEVIQACAARADAPVAAIGIASMAESGVALDAGGRALTPLLRWDRTVGAAHLQAILADHPLLPARSGVPATTKPAAVVLTALRAEQPEVMRATRHWAGVADLVAHALTGVRATDHTLGARTMLAVPDRAEWDAGLLDDLGLDVALLPELREPGLPVGPTLADAGFGLAAGIPLHVAGHDHAVGAWPAGVRRPGEVADSLGTAEAIIRIADRVDRADAVARGFAVSRSVDGTALTVLGGSPACGALLAEWETMHPGSLELLRRAEPDPWITSAATVLPYPSGRQCPLPDASARLQVIDADDERDATRAVLQGLVLHARWMRETADTLAGSPASAITLLGSLAERIPAWAPLVATAGVRARRCTTAEAVAAGAALVAAVREHTASADLVLPSRAVAPASAPGLGDARRRFLNAVGVGEADRTLTEGER